MKKIKSIHADLAIMTASIFWGSTFIITKGILTNTHFLSYLFIRFLIALISLASFKLIFFRALNKNSNFSYLFKDGLILGTILFLIYFFQTLGLTTSAASNAAIITGLYVIITPVIGGVFFKFHVKRKIYICAGIITIGLIIFSGGFKSFKSGDLFLFINAVFVAVHIILTGIYTKKHDTLSLNLMQFFVITVLSGIFIVFTKTDIRFPEVNYMVIYLYLALFCTILPFLIQTFFQRFTTSERAALILISEPVFAMIFAVVIGKEVLDIKAIVGSSIIIAGLIAAEMK